MFLENLTSSCSLTFAKNIQQQFNIDNIDNIKNTLDTSDDDENANKKLSNEDNGIAANTQDCAITC